MTIVLPVQTPPATPIEASSSTLPLVQELEPAEQTTEPPEGAAPESAETTNGATGSKDDNTAAVSDEANAATSTLSMVLPAPQFEQSETHIAILLPVGGCRDEELVVEVTDHSFGPVSVHGLRIAVADYTEMQIR